MAEHKHPSRRGVRGNPIVYAVLAGFLLLAVYLFATWSSPTPSSSRQTGSGHEASGRASSANSSHVPAGNPAYPQPAVTSADGTKP